MPSLPTRAAKLKLEEAVKAGLSFPLLPTADKDDSRRPYHRHYMSMNVQQAVNDDVHGYLADGLMFVVKHLRACIQHDFADPANKVGFQAIDIEHKTDENRVTIFFNWSRVRGPVSKL
jgi:hypothetical protein